MAETVNVKNIGLRGVTVADSKVSFIDGEKGILIYRGYRIEELVFRFIKIFTFRRGQNQTFSTDELQGQS